MATQPTQVISVPHLQARPQQPRPIGKFPPPVAVTANAINAFKLFFPLSAAAAIDESAIVAAFSANNAVNGGYFPDPDENADITHMYGDLINKPVYGSLTLGNTDPHKVNGNQYTGVDNVSYTFSNIVLPIALVEMSQKSIVGKTRISGREGSIKQYLNLDDWDIKINAVITNPADQAPVDFMTALYKMKRAAVEMPVTNYFLNAFGVTYIVIEDINPVQEEGQYAKLALTISACSSIPESEFLP